MDWIRWLDVTAWSSVFQTHDGHNREADQIFAVLMRIGIIAGSIDFTFRHEAQCGN